MADLYEYLDDLCRELSVKLDDLAQKAVDMSEIRNLNRQISSLLLNYCKFLFHIDKFITQSVDCHLPFRAISLIHVRSPFFQFLQVRRCRQNHSLPQSPRRLKSVLCYGIQGTGFQGLPDSC